MQQTYLILESIHESNTDKLENEQNSQYEGECSKHTVVSSH